MLVDLARNDLGRVAAPRSIAVDPYLSVERYSHVMHIVSGVNGKLKPGKDAFDLFAAAFPAGTLVGAPKIRAIELMNQWEPASRGLYGGTVGYFGHGDSMDQAIAIRTIVFEEGRYSYHAGAGIVADSDPGRGTQRSVGQKRGDAPGPQLVSGRILRPRRPSAIPLLHLLVPFFHRDDPALFFRAPLVPLRQNLLNHVDVFPARQGRFALRPRHILGRIHLLVFVDIAGAVGERSPTP